jgi:large repetitive protein
VFDDTNNNGVLDGTETGVGGVVLTLTGTDDLGNPVTLTTTTAPDGNWSFGDLRPGTYTVTETQPTGLLDGTDTPGTAGATSPVNDKVTVTLTPGVVSKGTSFADIKPSTFGGIVFDDPNQNGTQDSGEAGIPGVTVTLTGTDDLGNPVSVVVTTAADGTYTFPNLRPGTYTVTETQPADYVDGNDTPGTGVTAPANDTFVVTLTPGTTSTGNTLAEYVPATLGGTVYGDANNDGIMDPTETGIGGVTITLTGTDDRGNPVTLTTTTNTCGATPASADSAAAAAADVPCVVGSYLFTGLRPGTYTVTETQPDGIYDGKDTPGNLGATSPTNDTFIVTLNPGSNGTGNNFGEAAPASLSGKVVDPAGNPISGVTITLTGTDINGKPVSKTVTTGIDGTWTFDKLPPGDYKITETQPNGYTSGTNTPGTAGGTVSGDTFTVTVGAGITGTGYVYVDVPPAPIAVVVTSTTSTTSTTTTTTAPPVPTTAPPVVTTTTTVVPAAAGSIGERVWIDKNKNGVQDPGEPGVGGVTITLKSAGSPDRTVQTDADGRYRFDALPAGSYTVTVDSLKNPSNGPKVRIVNVSANEIVRTVNFAFAKLGDVRGVSIDAPRELAFTGSDVFGLIAQGLILLLIGSTIVVTTRRRRRKV